MDTIKRGGSESWLVFAVISITVAIDQITKRIAENLLQDTGTLSFFFDTFRLQFVKNPGAFLGFGSEFSQAIRVVLLVAFPVVILIAAMILVFFSRSLSSYQRVFISLMIGGGAGNLIDRFLFGGKVTDFLNVGIASVRTGIFNGADLAIMFGMIGLLLFSRNQSRLQS